MSSTVPPNVVFDCTVFAQALINPRGPAGACLIAAQQGVIKLYVSDYVLQEIRGLPGKLPARFALDADRVDRFILDLAKYCEPVAAVLPLFTYARDPDDAHYVDLAIACGASILVSRDRDLLDLMLDANAEGKALRAQHPGFRVIAPTDFLKELRSS